MCSERIRENGIKAVVLVLFYAVLSVYTLVAEAQTPEGQYTGGAASFQTR
ncbi:MAG TPA: hypothetical protein VKZ86_14910 [Cyclobacteriaceae bacterium]|nr:hypothetical protein [Cyclobacteriaceae bacterium]